MSSGEERGPYDQLVSPLVYGQRFDTHLRKAALPDIFQAVDPAAVRRLFERAGDKKAEERARIIGSDQGCEEISRALLMLRVRRRLKLARLLRAGWKAVKIFS
ncbi:transcriptional and immune response regulator-like [Narcine bancroftii]|uniref:transcriptional and immune response regulator-like n=1 Tax=Narcine bancroftii TaxID=1343680 RepID=UPI003831BC36